MTWHEDIERYLAELPENRQPDLSGVTLRVALDLESIMARAEAATPGPWEQGSVWVSAPAIGSECAHCRQLGGPAVTSEEEYFGGQPYILHVHRRVDDGDEHWISGPEGAQIAGNYEEELGGIIDPADAEFIAHARTDVPALVAEVEGLRAALREATP